MASVFPKVVDRLKLCAHRCQYTPHQPLVEMKRILDALNKAFNKLVDMMLTKEMKVEDINQSID